MCHMTGGGGGEVWVRKGVAIVFFMVTCSELVADTVNIRFVYSGLGSGDPSIQLGLITP